MDFGYVLKRAWQIIWKFKVLWIFGILASCGQAGSSGGSNSGYRFSGQDINLAPEYFTPTSRPCDHCSADRSRDFCYPRLDCPGYIARNGWTSWVDPWHNESRTRS